MNNAWQLVAQSCKRGAEAVTKLKEELTMNKTRFDEIFDLLAELEMRLFYVKNDPGEMPIIEVAEVHEKVKAALVEWNHLASFAEEE